MHHRRRDTVLSAGCRAALLLLGVALVVGVAVVILLPRVAGSHIAMHPRRVAVVEEAGRVSPETAIAHLERLEASDPDAPRHAMQYVHAAMLHYWPEEAARDVATECRLVDDPLVWLRLRILDAMEVAPLELARHERRDWRAALRLGVGLCSQQSIVLAGALRERGIDATVMGLGGHVVVVARAGVAECILDPDFGVVLPMTLEEAERTSSAVFEAYRDAGLDESDARNIAAMYAAEGNGVYPARLLGVWTRRGMLGAILVVCAGFAIIALASRSMRATQGATQGATTMSRS
jgi:hypothetical protein